MLLNKESLVISTALDIAYSSHLGQKDKGGHPYIGHALRVAGRTNSKDPEILSVALLHDVVEDTEVTIRQIRSLFGRKISDAVDAISQRPNESVVPYYRRLVKNEIAVEVKKADLLDNADIGRYDSLFPSKLALSEALGRCQYYSKIYRWLCKYGPCPWKNFKEDEFSERCS